MKNTKTALLLILAGTVSFSIGLWFYSTMESLGVFEYSTAVVVAIIVIFSIVIGLRRMKDEKKGFVVDDELSIKVKQKAAATSFSFSFLIWAGIATLMGDMEIRATIPIGIGIIVTGLMYIILWIYYSKKGLSDANAD